MKTKSVRIDGRSAIVKKVNALMAAMADEDREGARGSIMTTLGDAASLARGAMVTMARLNGYPSAVVESIFSYGRLPASLRVRKQPSALAGVAKQETLKVWRAAKDPRSQKAKVSAGGRVAMSLAAMYEFGTSKLAGRGAIQTAVQQSRGPVLDTIRGGLTKLLGDNTR